VGNKYERRTLTDVQNDNDEFLTLDNTRASINPDDIDIQSTHEEITREEVSLREQLSKLDINDLRDELRKKNCQIGPLDARNRKLYESKLARMEISSKSGTDLSINRFSIPLQRVIMDEEMGTENTKRMGELEEHIIRNEYLLSTGKNEVSFFCYLLLDPSMISRASKCTIREFIMAIFYVGKGKHARPLQHLIDANRCRPLMSNKAFQPTAKLKRILQLWDRGDGVISLHISLNIHSAEALVREGAMIEAIGIDNLTNVRRGNFRGLPNVWTRRQIEEFGAMLLRKAHVIFRNERCRPVFEGDVAM